MPCSTANTWRGADSCPDGSADDNGLRRFTESLSKFTRYSRFQTIASLKYGDMFNNSSIVSSIEFDRCATPPARKQSTAALAYQHVKWYGWMDGPVVTTSTLQRQASPKRSKCSTLPTSSTTPSTSTSRCARCSAAPRSGWFEVPPATQQSRRRLLTARRATLHHQLPVVEPIHQVAARVLRLRRHCHLVGWSVSQAMPTQSSPALLTLEPSLCSCREHDDGWDCALLQRNWARSSPSTTSTRNAHGVWTLAAATRRALHPARMTQKVCPLGPRTYLAPYAAVWANFRTFFLTKDTHAHVQRS